MVKKCKLCGARDERRRQRHTIQRCQRNLLGFQCGQQDTELASLRRLKAAVEDERFCTNVALTAALKSMEPLDTANLYRAALLDRAADPKLITEAKP